MRLNEIDVNDEEYTAYINTLDRADYIPQEFEFVTWDGETSYKYAPADYLKTLNVDNIYIALINGECVAITTVETNENEMLDHLIDVAIEQRAYEYFAEKYRSQPESEPKTMETSYSETELINEYTEGVESIG